ncbi:MULTISPECIES: aldehyde dehydrogenase [unclassified Flavobacterium]|jgi:aldehyde dehydrogenase (NAD+)|uniref:aldehyde dehydrogenase n=1 Tax=unclassified Flavobacterium TaxID=196869 RepID=UPI00070B3E09|nr:MULTISPECIES: aldehyde dehydrogenase [unclassified Flavobacterium]KRD61647.1 aldehyde dehydrogenase [Flavobacterium sp. Root935]TDX12479.1 aldehyde dehydrogenase (NAD+) [Flavobacterium sp. S87F.05.LMB.W.Kidney.N]BDU27333.1 aldehyde dehydrogenase [Flavobacterium sp. GSB-24]
MDYKSDIGYRKETLKKLLYNIQKSEDLIIKALYDDFKKPEFEAVVTETSYVISELKDVIKNIHKWAKPKRVFPSLLNFPSTDKIYKEPYGNVLIIAPWNYPFQLALCPLIAAVAAGNRVTLKPSELTPHTSAVIARIIEKTFHINHVEVFEGGVEVSNQLLAQRWDYIFFTGSVAVGKIVAKAAAENLTPVTLELGGKNPCIVDETADLKLAAKRIVWGKFINAGQTCIAPDYIMVQKNMKVNFITYLMEEIIKAYGKKIDKSPDFARIINIKNWYRLTNMIQNENVLFGGESDANQLYIAPTLLEEPDLDSPVMKEEIFGPILPILTYENENDIEKVVSRYEKPLSFYIFSENNSFTKKLIKKYSFGGGCINDTVVHFSNKRLPFGGVGHSGIGAYHGQLSFDTFSHHKAMVKKGNWLDLPMRYAPYKEKLASIKRILDWL